MIATSLEIPQLLIQSGSSQQQCDLLPGAEQTLGRHPENDVQLSDRCASRYHAKLVNLQHQHYCYVDLNSRNGSKLQGQAITQPIVLQHGDRIRIGDTWLIFQDIPAHRATGAGSTDQAQVLLLQADALQGKIWQSILRSQNIDSFWESSEIDLRVYLPRQAAAAALPKLIVLDTELLGNKVYDLCGWCRQKYPQIQIIVNNSQERQIVRTERQKATQVGCLNWFPAFREPKLLDNVAGIVVQVNGVMQTLGGDSLQQDKLFEALKSLEQLIAEVASLAPAAKPNETPPASPSTAVSPQSNNSLDLTQVSRKR